MSSSVKKRWFILLLLVAFFCSSCAWIKSNGQWSFKKKELKSKILKNPNDYNSNYELGVAYATRGSSFSFPSTTHKKFFFHKAIPYLEKAIGINPESAEAHLVLGEVFGKEQVNDGFGAIKHTIIAKKLFERENNLEGLSLAKGNMKIFSKKFFSFYLLGYAGLQIPQQSQLK